MPTPKGPPELKHLDHVLVSPTAIKRRIAQLGAELNKDYAKKDLMVVAIVNGALIFTADLLRQMRSPLRLDCLRASSYHDGTKAVQLRITPIKDGLTGTTRTTPGVVMTGLGMTLGQYLGGIQA